MTASCERYDTANKKCEEIAPLHNMASSLCCCSFQDKYIFKFGGNHENKMLSPYIERYDIASNSWTVIDPKISPFEKAK